MDNLTLHYACVALGGFAGTGILFFVLSVITVMNRKHQETLQSEDSVTKQLSN